MKMYVGQCFLVAALASVISAERYNEIKVRRFLYTSYRPDVEHPLNQSWWCGVCGGSGCGNQCHGYVMCRAGLVECPYDGFDTGRLQYCTCTYVHGWFSLAFRPLLSLRFRSAMTRFTIRTRIRYPTRTWMRQFCQTPLPGPMSMVSRTWLTVLTSTFLSIVRSHIIKMRSFQTRQSWLTSV